MARPPLIEAISKTFFQFSQFLHCNEEEGAEGRDQKYQQNIEMIRVP